MKDIDFDELDRAVNSLMSGSSKSEPAQDSAKPTPAQPVKDDAVPDHPVPASASPQRSLATRRRGQFMDMVRPSAPATTIPSRPASRSGVRIDPGAAFIRPSSPAAGGGTPGQIPHTDNASSGSPIARELAGFSAAPEAGTGRLADPDSQPEDLATPLTSPFLPDAVVEKRPLGRQMTTALPEQLLAADETVKDIQPSDQAPDVPETVSGTAPKQSLPAELQGDVMAIESDTNSFSAEPSPQAEFDGRERPVRPSATLQPRQAASSSIPQQYKIHPKTDEPATGAIYDTAAYRQPLTHPAKKKPGWAWVAAIILILLLGAGGGAALYMGII